MSTTNLFGQEILWERQVAFNHTLPHGIDGSARGLMMDMDAEGNVLVLCSADGPVMIGNSEFPEDPTIIQRVRIFMIKYSPNGAILWAKPVGKTTAAGEFVIDHEGSILVWAASYDEYVSEEDHGGIVLMKFDKDGQLLWVRYETGITNSLGSAAHNTRGRRLVIDKDNNLIIYEDKSNYYGYENESKDGGLVLMKYSPEGTKLWEKIIAIDVHLGSDYPPRVNKIVLDHAGNIIINGSAVERDSVFYNIYPIRFIAKFTPTGELIWKRTSAYFYLNDLAIDNENNIYASGYGWTQQLDSIRLDDKGGFIFKLSPSGVVEWSRSDENLGIVDGLTFDRNGDLIATGTTNHIFQYQNYYTRRSNDLNAFVLKLNRYGDYTASMVSRGSSYYGWQTLVDKDGYYYTLGDYNRNISFGCTNFSADNVSFYLMKYEKFPVNTVVFITGPTAICKDKAVTLTCTYAPDADDYTWELPPGVTSLSGSNITKTNAITVLIDASADQSQISVKPLQGCNYLYGQPYMINIKQPLEMPVFLSGPLVVCPGDEKVIYKVNHDDNALKYIWTFGEGVSASNKQTESDSIQINFSSGFNAGAIGVKSFNVCGTSDLQLVSVTSYGRPIKPVIAGEAVVCAGDNKATWTVQDVEGAQSYQWVAPHFVVPNPLFPTDKNQLVATIFPQFQSGQIRVAGVGVCGVGEISDPFSIKAAASTGSAGEIYGSTKICESDVSFSVNEVSNATRYAWSIPFNFDSHGEVITSSGKIDLHVSNFTTGIISVKAFNMCEQAGDSSKVFVETFKKYSQPLIKQATCGREISISEGENIEWYKYGELIIGADSTILTVLDSGNYSVKISNYCGIEEGDPVSIYPINGDKIFIPNVITPNGDYKNEYFVVDKSLANEASLSIVNKWGDKVYFSPSYSNEWNGSDLPNGTYFYSLKHHCLMKPVRGTISILR